MKNNYHQPVLVSEVLKLLHIKKNGLYLDATLGTGGHSLEILAQGGKVLGIEADPEILQIAINRLRNFNGMSKAILGNFRNLDSIAKANGFDKADGILFDLGVTNLQLKSFARGFSFESPEAKLDMRIDSSSEGVLAKDLLNILRLDQLLDLFQRVLPKNQARKIASEVTRFRTTRPFEKVKDLLDVTGFLGSEKRIHPATKAFLALRIAVNSELENLQEALPKAFYMLKPKSRLAVISFHSGEDAIVKNFYKKMEKLNQANIITKKPLMASPQEVLLNRRSRSAKLRVIEKK